MKELGFNIDKQLSLGLRRAIYVDDTRKEFAISKGKNLKVYKYSDLKEWRSISEAQRELNIHNIIKVCKGTQHLAGGYNWRYKNE